MDRRVLHALVSACVLVAASGAGGGAPAEAAPGPVRGDTTSGPDDVMLVASSRAMADGDPVEVEPDTTEISKTVAQPDGSFRTETSAAPVRVRRDSGWVPVDPHWVSNGDGSFSPAAIPLFVQAFSGGTRLMSLARGGDPVGLDFPVALPEPVLHGDELIYPGVSPDVDLVLRADATGVRTFLVVRSAEGAKSPLAAAMRLGVSQAAVEGESEGGGVTLHPSGGGDDLVVSDGVAWSVAPGVAQGLRRSAAVGKSVAGDLVDVEQPPVELKPVETKPVPGGLVVAADPAWLQDPSTTFPLVIDPGIGAQQDQASVEVHSDASKLWINNEATVGNQRYRYPMYKARHWWRFNISGIPSDAVVTRAGFNHFIAHTTNSECNQAKSAYATPVELWTVEGAKSVWPGGTPKLNLGSSTKAPGDVGHGCGGTAEWIGSGTPAKGLTAAIDSYRAANKSTIELMLKSKDENSLYSWRRYTASGGGKSNLPTLTAEYWLNVNRPTLAALFTKGSGAGTQANPYVTSQNELKFTAKVSSRTKVKQNVQFFANSADGKICARSAVISAPEGASVSWPDVPDSCFAGGKAAKISAFASDPKRPAPMGAWSAPIYVRVDRKGPSTPKFQPLPPDVVDYYSPGPVINFSAAPAPATDDVRTYQWMVEGPGQTTKWAGFQPKVKATDPLLAVRLPLSGLHTVRLKAIDAAGNATSASTEVQVNGAYVSHEWPLDAPQGEDQADLSLRDVGDQSVLIRDVGGEKPSARQLRDLKIVGATDARTASAYEGEIGSGLRMAPGVMLEAAEAMDGPQSKDSDGDITYNVGSVGPVIDSRGAFTFGATVEGLADGEGADEDAGIPGGSVCKTFKDGATGAVLMWQGPTPDKATFVLSCTVNQWRLDYLDEGKPAVLEVPRSVDELDHGARVWITYEPQTSALSMASGRSLEAGKVGKFTTATDVKLSHDAADHFGLSTTWKGHSFTDPVIHAVVIDAALPEGGLQHTLPFAPTTPEKK